MRTIKRSVSLLLAILCMMSYTGKAFTAGLTDEVGPQDALNDVSLFEQDEASRLESAFETSGDVAIEEGVMSEAVNVVTATELFADECDIPEADDATEEPVDESDVPETDDATEESADEGDVPETGDATEEPADEGDVPETGDATEEPADEGDVPKTGDATEEPADEGHVPETGDVTESPADESGIPETSDATEEPADEGHVPETGDVTESPADESGIPETGDAMEEPTEEGHVPETGDATESPADESDAPGMKSGLKSVPIPQTESLTPQGQDDYKLLDKIDILVPLATQTEEMEPLSAPFDFSVDPYGLIEATHAIRYGGGSVEPGARVIFRNHDGDYNFSSRSDILSVRNRADSPVQITINVRYDDTEIVRLANAEELETESLLPMLCIAVTDNAGNQTALNQDGEATIVEILPGCESEDDFVEYSFRLEGKCNPNADWRGVNVDAKLSVIWSVSPILEGTTGGGFETETSSYADSSDRELSETYKEPHLLIESNTDIAPAESNNSESMEDGSVLKSSDETKDDESAWNQRDVTAIL